MAPEQGPSHHDVEPPSFRPASQHDLVHDFGSNARILNNLAALRMLRHLQAEDRLATAAEQQVLAAPGGGDVSGAGSGMHWREQPAR